MLSRPERRSATAIRRFVCRSCHIPLAHDDVFAAMDGHRTLQQHGTAVLRAAANASSATFTADVGS